ncbi:hypothetical protein WZ78_10065 [Leuconostoc mesenteroides subsp. dextranicum]|nr:hypothetical protein WZ78_10065 [Leuconostoc mesenteroides subsp. dextranicum]
MKINKKDFIIIFITAIIEIYLEKIIDFLIKEKMTITFSTNALVIVLIITVFIFMIYHTLAKATHKNK